MMVIQHNIPLLLHKQNVDMYQTKKVTMYTILPILLSSYIKNM